MEAPYYAQFSIQTLLSVQEIDGSTSAKQPVMIIDNSTHIIRKPGCLARGVGFSHLTSIDHPAPDSRQSVARWAQHVPPPESLRPRTESMANRETAAGSLGCQQSFWTWTSEIPLFDQQQYAHCLAFIVALVKHAVFRNCGELARL